MVYSLQLLLVGESYDYRVCLVESSVICVFLQGYAFEIELYMYKTENILSRLVLHFRQVNTWPPLTRY